MFALIYIVFVPVLLLLLLYNYFDAYDALEYINHFLVIFIYLFYGQTCGIWKFPRPGTGSDPLQVQQRRIL